MPYFQDLTISVVIPTCHRPYFLQAAIESVETARLAALIPHENIEIIVIDDGHDEVTKQLCGKWNHDAKLQLRYQFSLHGPSAGPSACRNQGIIGARGEFIYLLDDDDRYLPNRFIESARLFCAEKYDVVLEPTRRVYLNEPENESFITGPYGQQDNVFRFLLNGGRRSHITPGATAFRKQAFERVGGYDETLRYGEDGEFLLRLCFLSNVALITGNPVAECTIHEHNTTRICMLDYWQSIKFYSHLYQKLRKKEPVDDVLFLKNSISKKLDFALTSYRRESRSYYRRILGGIKALQSFNWRCLTVSNAKSILVWLSYSSSH